MREVFDLYVEKQGTPDDYVCAEITLPATQYELLEVMDWVRPGSPDQLDFFVEQYRSGFEFLAPHILPTANLFSLNALAEKLAELDDRQAVAFHGLVVMESGPKGEKLSLQRLLDLAYSADCCHVVDALSDSQLGRFYAENGFVPEVDDLPDKVYDLLDFEQIGRQMRMAEGGIFLPGSKDGPGGYVVRHSDLVQAPPIPTGPPSKPDYIFRLNVSTIPMLQEGRPRRYAQLTLPATGEQIQKALDEVRAADPEEVMAAILDGPLHCLTGNILFNEDIATLNTLAKELAQMYENGTIPTFKAVLEELGAVDLDQIADLTADVGEYTLESDIRGVEDVAEDELKTLLCERDAERVMKHLDLHAYGQEALARDNAVVTHYGLLCRKDRQPIQAPAEQKQEEGPGMGGMEMM